MKETLFVFA